MMNIFVLAALLLVNATASKEVMTNHHKYFASKINETASSAVSKSPNVITYSL
jgi:hypothetical protein